LVELIAGAGVSDLPKVAAAMVTRGGRSGQATTIQIASELEREREWGEWGWAGSI
jgi:hypothetical protein